jgi:hypothetical protein
MSQRAPFANGPEAGDAAGIASLQSLRKRARGAGDTPYNKIPKPAVGARADPSAIERYGTIAGRRLSRR